MYNWSEKIFQWIISTYASALEVVLDHTAAHHVRDGGNDRHERLSVYQGSQGILSRSRIPAGMQGSIQGQQHISYQALVEKAKWFEEQVRNDPAVEMVDMVAGSAAAAAAATPAQS